MKARAFPNETPAYRTARDQLLAAEIALRAEVEQVAKLRRTLPIGGKIPQDYEFEEAAGRVKLSQLFPTGRDTLFLYNFMYGPKMARPCPMCTSFLDGLNAQAVDLTQRIGVAVAARSPIARIREFADGRGWKQLRMVSSAENTYNRDYFGEDAEGNQWPMANVFVRRTDGIHHFWGTELLYAETAKGTDTRHIDMLWPLWNVLDLTPEGRGADFYPKLSY
jgi:predicted dithiol-disulfide oxidoreductase (DUF899 family)